MEGERVTFPMRLFPLFLLASVATLAAGQAFAPTARAQPVVAPPEYHVRLDWQKAEPVPGGLVVRGRVTNTGTTSLTYTQVTATLLDRAGREVFRGNGYLTASPLPPGRSAEFRAFGAFVPRFTGLRMVFHEAGHSVLVDYPRASASDKGSEATAKAF